MSANKNNVADILWNGPGDFEILSLNVIQAVSEPYFIKVKVKSASLGLTFEDFLHTEVKLFLKCGDALNENRVFSGIITRFSQCRTRHGNLETSSRFFYAYEIEIRPTLWLSKHQKRSKVFQKADTKKIVTDVLEPYNINQQWEIQGALKNRAYCVQYDESDFAFISRLLEEDGIYYYFDQETGTVIFADDAALNRAAKPKAEATYVEEISPRFKSGKNEFISDFTYGEQVSTGRFALHHYNYETSQTNITVEDQETRIPCFPEVESYEHSCNYLDHGEGRDWAKIRKEEKHASAKMGRGTTSCRSFEAGYTFTMNGHFRDDLNVKWLLTSCHISAGQGAFECAFTALPTTVPFRPLRVTPKPKVFGLQTATVTGPEGSQVYLDEMGRCKIQFHWDREGPKTDGSSMWVRVANNYAGKDYGIQWIPRIGHEVLVTFIDGNPDLPVVTGRVYNDFNGAPLGPPKKWQNIIKTIKDNHLMFDDEDNKELVDIRAQKNMNTLVLADKTVTVGHNETVKVGNDAEETVKKNKTVTVEEEDYKEKTGRHKEVTVGETYKLEVGTDHTTSVGGSQTDEVAGSINIVSTGDAVCVTSPVKICLTSGGSCIELSPEGIQLSIGGSTIQMTPALIRINGPLVRIN